MPTDQEEQVEQEPGKKQIAGVSNINQNTELQFSKSRIWLVVPPLAE
jgi:hypothetical protein